MWDAASVDEWVVKLVDGLVSKMAVTTADVRAATTAAWTGPSKAGEKVPNSAKSVNCVYRSGL